MADKRPALTRDEQRKRLQVKARDLDHKVAQNAFDDDAALNAMVRKSIKDHGA